MDSVLAVENNLKKFENPYITAKGDERAHVELTALDTLWLNTGTLCNLQCEGCYIESSPKNDKFLFLTLDDVEQVISDSKDAGYNIQMIGLTGGEPFMNKEIIEILTCCLEQDVDVLVLTNAYKLIQKYHKQLLQLNEKYTNKFKLRISLDATQEAGHDKVRGAGKFSVTLQELAWLVENNFTISIAGREAKLAEGSDSLLEYQRMLDEHNIDLSIIENNRLVLFPEMDLTREVPEITTSCWQILKRSPSEIMCSSERMIVKRKSTNSLEVLPCTLLTDDEQFVLGNRLTDMKSKVQLNHQYCASFCVLGKSSCSK